MVPKLHKAIVPTIAAVAAKRVHQAVVVVTEAADKAAVVNAVDVMADADATTEAVTIAAADVANNPKRTASLAASRSNRSAMQCSKATSRCDPLAI